MSGNSLTKGSKSSKTKLVFETVQVLSLCFEALNRFGVVKKMLLFFVFVLFFVFYTKHPKD